MLANAMCYSIGICLVDPSLTQGSGQVLYRAENAQLKMSIWNIRVNLKTAFAVHNHTTRTNVKEK